MTEIHSYEKNRTIFLRIKIIALTFGVRKKSYPVKSKKQKPTKGELAILKALWKQGPSTVREVNEKLNERKEEKPVTCLGKTGTLGWTSWLESEQEHDHVEDLLLQVDNYV